VAEETRQAAEGARAAADEARRAAELARETQGDLKVLLTQLLVQLRRPGTRIP
jgi:hypothetical protein